MDKDEFDPTQKIWKPAAVVVKRVNDADHSVDVIASTADIDRDHDRLLPEGMVVTDPDRIPLVAAHFYYDLMNHIGDVGGIELAGKKIKAKPSYFVGLGNAQADWAWALVQLGVAAYSVGFIPLEVEWADMNDAKVVERVEAGKEPKRTFARWELVELSHVIVPSNRGAVQRLADMGVLTGKAATDALARSVDTPMAARADLLLKRAFRAFEESRPTKAIAEVAAPSAQPIAAPVVQAEEQAEDAASADVMALFSVSPIVADASPPPAPPLGQMTVPELRTYLDSVLENAKIARAGDLEARIASMEEAVEAQDVEIGKLYEAVHDELEAVRNLVASASSDLIARVDEAAGKAESVAREAVKGIPLDSVAYVSHKELIAALMDGVREVVDDRIAVARADPEKFVQTAKSRRRGK